MKKIFRAFWSTQKDTEAKHYQIAARALNKKKDGIALSEQEKKIIRGALSRLRKMKKTNVLHFLKKHF